jgi:hypothetical protein
MKRKKVTKHWLIIQFPDGKGFRENKKASEYKLRGLFMNVSDARRGT